MDNNINFHAENYPVSGALPETWPLNSLYLTVLDRLINEFEKRGEEWRFAVEMEFIPYSVSAFEREITADDLCPDRESFEILRGHSQPSLSLYDDLKQKEELPLSFFEGEADKIINYIKKNSDALTDYFEQSYYTKDQAIKEIEGFKEQLSNSDENISDTAKANIFMAYLHVYPSSQGGLRDIIEPRFGNHILGLGWWDDRGIAEIRLPPTKDHRLFIANYHRKIDLVFQASEKFHRVPMMDTAVPQPHYSLWKQDPDTGELRNTMKLANDDDAEINKRLAIGIEALAEEASFLINDFDYMNKSYNFKLDIGNTKYNTVAFRGRSLELRGKQSSNYIHLARDMVFILAASYCGRFSDCTEGLSRKHADTLEVKPDYLITQSLTSSIFKTSWASIVDQCSLGKNRRLDPSTVEDDKWIYSRRQFCTTFKCPETGKIQKVDLSETSGLKTLISSIKVQENGLLDTCHLPAFIADNLNSVIVTGTRYSIRNKSHKTHHGPGTLQKQLLSIESAKTLANVFTKDEINEIKNFYEPQLQKRLQEISKLTVHEIFNELVKKRNRQNEISQECSEDDTEPLLAVKRLMKMVIDEEKTSKEINPTLPESLEELRAAPSTIIKLRDFMREAVDEQKRNLHANGQATNFIVNGLEGAMDYLNYHALHPVKSLESSISIIDMTCYFLSLQDRGGNAGSILNTLIQPLDDARHYAYLALQNDYEPKTVIKMLNQCVRAIKISKKEFIAEYTTSKKGDSQIKVEALKVLRKELEKCFDSLQENYQNLIKEVNNIPETSSSSVSKQTRWTWPKFGTR